MARCNQALLESYPSISYQECNHPIVFVIDMIQGYVKKGTMADESISSIVPSIVTMLEGLQARTIFIHDAHPPKTKEFERMPKHCIIGSDECDIVTELQPYVHEAFCKNNKNAFFCSEFQIFLEERMEDYEEIVIVGCHSDQSIMPFALSLQAYFDEHNMKNKRIIVPIHCMDTYHITQTHDAYEWNAFSIANMYLNGIEVIQHFIEI